MANTRLETESTPSLNKLVSDLYQHCVDIAGRIPITQKDIVSYKQIVNLIGSVEITNLFTDKENCKEKYLVKISAPNYLFIDDINIELKDHTRIHSIKIAKFNQSQNMLITFFTNEKKRYFFVDAEKSLPIKDLLTGINKAIPFNASGSSNLAEIKLNKYCKEKVDLAHSSSFWARSWDNKHNSTGEHYDIINDPMVLSVFEDNLLKEGSRESLVIFDVGGGKGRLAKKLIDSIFHNHPSLKVTYVFVEPETSQFNIAKEVLQPLIEKYPQLTIDLQEGTLDNMKGRGSFGQYQGKVDVIISSGGPLNDQVVPYNIAQQTLTDFNSLLSVGGKIIATGISMVFFSKKDFNQNKLNVLNCLFKNEKAGFLQCYVLEKPTAIKHKKAHQEETRVNNDPRINDEEEDGNPTKRNKSIQIKNSPLTFTQKHSRD